ncbi:MAG: hypothetical protein IPH85_01095 [Ignavibacteria bacterium]|nr:hypothetical protein [Ignavibacteria bacterium]
MTFMTGATTRSGMSTWMKNIVVVVAVVRHVCECGCAVEDRRDTGHLIQVYDCERNGVGSRRLRNRSL